MDSLAEVALLHADIGLPAEGDNIFKVISGSLTARNDKPKQLLCIYMEMC